jgi:hypothetical protein
MVGAINTEYTTTNDTEDEFLGEGEGRSKNTPPHTSDFSTDFFLSVKVNNYC